MINQKTNTTSYIGQGCTIYLHGSKDKYAGTIVKTKNGGKILYVRKDTFDGDRFVPDTSASTEIFTLRSTKNSKYVRQYNSSDSGDYLLIGKKEEFTDYD